MRRVVVVHVGQGAATKAALAKLVRDTVPVKDARWTGTLTAHSSKRGKQISMTSTVNAPDHYTAGDKLKTLAEQAYGELRNIVIRWEGGPSRLAQGSESQIAAAGAGKEVDPKRRTRTGDNAIRAITELKRRHDLDMVVENDKDTLRTGRGWAVNVPYVYGYFPGTVAPDGEGVDVCAGDDYDSMDVWIIDQVHPDTGTPDEPKVLVFWATWDKAHAHYLRGYTDGKAEQRIGAVHGVDYAGLKAYLKERKRA
jgi:hypothetical protein